MPDRKRPIKSERSRVGTVAPSSEPDHEAGDSRLAHPSDKPDLDERERRQSARRKAAGPGGPARPAPRPSGDAHDAEREPEPWGSDPTPMPPTDPVNPSSS